MRNTLTIQSSGSCKCICLDSVYDGTNSIYLSLDVKNVTSPKLQIYKDGTLTNTIALKASQENTAIVPEDLYGANVVITFKYLDDDYTGNTFTINFPEKLEGNLLIKKVSEYIYDANYTKQGISYLTSDDVDSALSTTSANPVQNKVITAALSGKLSMSDLYQEGGHWWEAPSGIHVFRYEGQDVSTYKLPYPYVFILVMKMGNYRGVAIALKWNDVGGLLWTNNLHDDTQSNNWYGWKQLH